MKARARPDSSIRNDSPWSLAEMMFMPICFSAFMIFSRRSEVVPAVVTTFLPLRSGKSLTPEVFLVSRRVPTSKMPMEKSTWR